MHEITIGDSKIRFFKANELLPEEILAKFKINSQSLASLQSGHTFLKDFRSNFQFEDNEQ